MSLGLSFDDARVAVLFAMRPSPSAKWDSAYRGLANVDVWDRTRDATMYEGRDVIVAHPPCRAWGRFAHLAKPREGERGLACYAVAMVRRNGGVLEHPDGSGLWDICGLPRPGSGVVDSYGGWSLKVEQWHWGHRCLKPTWLYIVGCSRSRMPDVPVREGEPTHEIFGKSRANGGKAQISHYEREHTPLQFALWLVSVARRCQP